MIGHRSAILLLGLVLALGCAGAQAEPIDQLRQFSAQTRTARGDFTQQAPRQNPAATKGPGAAGTSTPATTVVSRGSFEFLRPGKFRWTYRTPYEQLIISDGEHLFLYDKDLNQVTEKKLAGALPASPASILFGSNDFERDFKVENDGSQDGIDWIRATPTAKDSVFERIRIGFRTACRWRCSCETASGSRRSSRSITCNANPPYRANGFNTRHRRASMCSKSDERSVPGRRRRCHGPRPGHRRAPRAGAGTETGSLGRNDAAAAPGRGRWPAPPARSGQTLRMAFASGHPHSMILWGPPGVGKTTLARLMAGAFGLDFIAISAVLGGVKDIRDAVERAKATQARTGLSTVVFVDEVHRFNKAQQDAFLPHVESGLFVFVGATTENPSFEVVGALLSRAAVYVLQPLSTQELGELLETARARILPDLRIEEAARRMLIELADGDARRLLNALEVVANAAQEVQRPIDAEFLRATLPATLRRFDKGGENFYDQISALHKSVRGSDPDAAPVLDGAHARWRHRSAVRRPARDSNGQRGCRFGRSACAAACAGGRAGLRAPGLTRGRARLSAGDRLTSAMAPSPTLSTGPLAP